MTARTSMAALITLVRDLIYDPAGASQVFSDDQIQTALDANREEERYEELTPLADIAPGGAVSYSTWVSDDRHWEASITFTDAAYNVITGSSAYDYLAGRFTFSESQDAVLATGWTYDVYAAAADLCEQWAAKLKLQYDFSADGATYHRSQAVKGLLDRAATLRSQSEAGGAQSVRMYRSDLC